MYDDFRAAMQSLPPTIGFRVGADGAVSVAPITPKGIEAMTSELVCTDSKLWSDAEGGLIRLESTGTIHVLPATITRERLHSLRDACDECLATLEASERQEILGGSPAAAKGGEA